MFAGFCRPDRPRHVHMVGQRIVDCFNLAIRQKRFIGSICPWNRKAVGSLFCFAEIPRGNRDYLAICAGLHRRNHLFHRDPGHTKYSPSDLVVHYSASCDRGYHNNHGFLRSRSWRLCSPPRNNENPCTGGSPWPPRYGIPRTLSEESFLALCSPPRNNENPCTGGSPCVRYHEISDSLLSGHPL